MRNENASEIVNFAESRDVKFETLVKERGGVLSGVVDRIKMAYLSASNGLEISSPEFQSMWRSLKEEPLVRGLVLGTEGVLHSEPGKKLSTKEACAKFLLAGLLTGSDILKMTKNSENGSFSGQIMRGVSEMKKTLSKRTSNKTLVGSLEGIEDFLGTCPEMVSSLEQQLDLIVTKGAN